MPNREQRFGWWARTNHEKKPNDVAISEGNNTNVFWNRVQSRIQLGEAWPCLAHKQLIIRLYLKRTTNKKSFVSKNIHFLHPCVDKFGFYQMFVLLQVVLEVHHGNACEWLHSQRIYLQLPISLFLPFAWSAFIIKRASFALRRDLLILFKTVFLQLISPRFPHCTLLEGLCQASLVVRKYFSLLLYLHLSLVYV